MIYGINDKVPAGKLCLFSAQMMLSVFTATALIAQICGVEMSGALVGAGLSTIVYCLCTGFKSPMFISNSGAFVAPVLMAMAVGGYSAIAIGGVVTAVVYTLFGVLFSKITIDNLYRVMPKALIGSVTVVIGINLMGFIATYIGDTGNTGVIVALITVLSTALVSHYSKGVMSLFPFLAGTLIGYVVSIPLGLVDFSVFDGIHLLRLPSLAFTKWNSVSWRDIIPIIVVYIAFTVSAVCEAISDHAALSGIIGTDLFKNPGLSRIFIGEGVANLAGSVTGGLGQCSYGESVGTIGFSKCASVKATVGAALLLIAMGFLEPVQAFIASIPQCVIGGGTACVLYGFISASGIKVLQGVDLNNQKNLILCSVVMSIGVSGIALGGADFSISGTALALVVGIIINLLLKEKTE